MTSAVRTLVCRKHSCKSYVEQVPDLLEKAVFSQVRSTESSRSRGPAPRISTLVCRLSRLSRRLLEICTPALPGNRSLRRNQK